MLVVTFSSRMVDGETRFEVTKSGVERRDVP